MNMKPRILVSRAEHIPSENWNDYAACVTRAGGVTIPYDLDTYYTQTKLPEYEGIVLTAGIDIQPGRYSEEPHPKVTEWNIKRDNFETALIDDALQNNKALLCICRGIQLLNVWGGGSLLQHLPNREPHRARRNPTTQDIESGWHDVSIKSDSLLHQITEQNVIRVNSRHHQAITESTLGKNIVSTGIASDGIVEAIEITDTHWTLGIQWHPERPEMSENMTFDDGAKKIWNAFVEAAKLVS
ncbi:MAG: gamma-glutamyl-gamma-aminobutyrate hydrolase family protein [Chloroflexota bacterium]|nr:gamma-glutamyl-gamma-aminobutyrate hydrolase family protein [Chloroflexota bacterium]